MEILRNSYAISKEETMPMHSKAAILVEPNTPLVIDQVEFPDPAPDQVLIKLFASGICHSQLHQMHRTPQRAHSGTPAVFPTLLGHEATGVVVAAGRQVTHVQEGDHVMTTWVDRGAVEGAPPRPPVMVQWNGRTVPAGTATWTEYTLLSERLVLPLDKDVATDVTSIIGCAVLTGCGVIINTLGVRVSESVAVFGVGGVGLCAVAAAQIVGAYPIIAVDLSDDKLAFAERFGATHGVNATDGDPVKAIHELTGGGVDYAIDAIGAARTQEQILYAARPGGIGLKKGGTACLVGAVQELGRIDVEELRITQRTYTGTRGSLCRPDRDFPTFVRWYQRGQLNLNDLVTQRYTLDQINDAVADLSAGRIHGRSIIIYD
jgi:Zn-dependent alcohol dehydrogenase